ncbi:MAG: hypothetical protein IT373_28525 [Polyangiaceae bacterium]|nr:hypothetical protein [Polyangiaceae bacterium]
MTVQRGGRGPADGDVRLGRELAEIPILIVPGIMGTRLVQHHRARGDRGAHSTLVFNPCGDSFGHPVDPPDAHARCADAGVLSQPTRRLAPDRGHWAHDDEDTRRRWLRAAGIYDDGFDPETSEVDQFDPNQAFGTAYALIAYYLRLAEQLSGLDLSDLGHKPRVVCAGYDWRQSNAVSAQTLSEAVERAKRACHAEQVVLVAHSMGGLVSRYYCRYLGGRNVRLLVLIGSPTLGAPDAYSCLKHSLDGTMRHLFGSFWSPARARQIVRACPSTYELLPNRLYSAARPNWCEFDDSLTGYPPRHPGPPHMIQRPDAFSDCTAERLYLDPYTGIADGAQVDGDADWGAAAVSRDQCAVYATTARNFHEQLIENDKAWLPPNTSVVYSEGHDTILGGELGAVEPVSNPHGTWLLDDDMDPPGFEKTMGSEGDETVPTASANPSSLWSRSPRSTCRGNLVHKELPQDDVVINHVKRAIRNVIGGSS